MAEKEYIEKGSLLKHFDDVINNKFGDADFKKAAWGFSIYVDKMPAADVAPVKHGRWIEQEGWAPGDYYYTCSVCGEDYNTIDGSPDYNFCPNCGCKMDLTGGEQE